MMHVQASVLFVMSLVMCLDCRIITLLRQILWWIRETRLVLGL